MDNDRTNPNWGGQREGAGRKPTSFRLRLGDEFLITEHGPDWWTQSKIGKIVDIQRNKFVIRLDDRDITVRR